ncbi:MAG: recombinase family protein [Desulfobacterales bacterium]|nr:recombinase family protein [Desulfobacterales bacterium]MBS3809899.1 recombinase family protein [Desulfobacterales bacterium]
MKQEQDCPGRTLGYIRVSTADQDPEKNRADILIFANEKRFGNVEFVEETVRGTKNWKERQIKQIIDSLGNGDRLIVPEISRLGRSMLEIMEILAIAREKGISVYAVKGPWELNGTIQSKIMAMVFSMAAEIERDLIAERTKEALKARKAAGVRLGRPKGPGRSKLDPHKDEIKKRLDLGVPKSRIAKDFNTTSANLANWIKRHAS